MKSFTKLYRFQSCPAKGSIYQIILHSFIIYRHWWLVTLVKTAGALEDAQESSCGGSVRPRRLVHRRLFQILSSRGHESRDKGFRFNTDYALMIKHLKHFKTIKKRKMNLKHLKLDLHWSTALPWHVAMMSQSATSQRLIMSSSVAEIRDMLRCPGHRRCQAFEGPGWVAPAAAEPSEAVGWEGLRSGDLRLPKASCSLDCLFAKTESWTLESNR